MGWFFTNLHIHKPAVYDTNTFPALLTEILSAQGFMQKNAPEEADLSVAMFDAGGKWLSLCSDGLEFYTEESIQKICNPLSESLSADVLTVSCFDSDCLLLNRINRKLDLVSWAKIGSYPGVKARSTPAKWKDIISDSSRWKSALKQNYVFAEEALESIEPLLGFEPDQGRFCNELIPERFSQGVQTLYFALPQAASKSAPPRLSLPTFNLTPCEIGKETVICAVNKGGRSKGLAIAFSGNYVENEEIRFRDVQLEYAFDHNPRACVRLQLEKRQTQKGQWVYWAEIPSFELREAVKEGLPTLKAMGEEDKRTFGVRFIPEGDPGKLLDIAVHFIPLKNPEGQCGWCVWWYNKSKRAFIEEHNRSLREIMQKHNPPGGVKLLNVDDYEID